jgi:hypothetical protein
MLRLSEHNAVRIPIVLTEFGGIALIENSNEGSWGYSVCSTPQELSERYTALLDAVRPLSSLAGFCYTQFSDTFQEANGLVYADRTPKIPLDIAARATSGFTQKEDEAALLIWRKRLMELQH